MAIQPHNYRSRDHQPSIRIMGNFTYRTCPFCENPEQSFGKLTLYKANQNPETHSCRIESKQTTQLYRKSSPA